MRLALIAVTLGLLASVGYTQKAVKVITRPDQVPLIQQWLDEGRSYVVLANPGEPYHLYDTITMKPNSEILCESGNQLIWHFSERKNGITVANNTRLILHGCSLTILWEGATDPVVDLTAPHVIAGFGVSNVIIEGGTFTGPGDGIFFAPSSSAGRVPSSHVRISDVTCERNKRSGLNIVACDQCVISNSQFNNTSGISPAAGLVIESWNASDIFNILIQDCMVDNNAGLGYLVGFSRMITTSPPVAVKFERCGGTRIGSKFPVRVIGFAPEDPTPVPGFVEFDLFKWE